MIQTMADPDEYHIVLLERLHTWLAFSKYDPCRPNLFRYMDMTADEFIEWRQTGIPPKEGDK
jgi:hypothetical protein